MKKQTIIVVGVLFGLGAACGSGTGKALRDGAVDVALPGSGGTGHASGGGTGGVTVLGAGGVMTGGVSMGRGGSSGAGGGGAGGTGARPDGSPPATDSNADKNAEADGSADSEIASCERAGDICAPMTSGCAVCPAGSYARTTRRGCPSTSWCCTQNVPARNQCTEGGGICGFSSAASCPDGWTLMRAACSSSGDMCCAPVSCPRPPQPDAGAVVDTSPPPAPLAIACTKALSCLGAEEAYDQGISSCVARATKLRLMDQSLFTYPMVLNDDRDWLFHFGLEQNVDCIAAADGCEAVRACLAPPQSPTICAGGSQDYLYGRRCADATHLLGCSLDTDVRIDCAKLGTKCVESPPTSGGDSGLAACALPSPGGPATPEVTCQGNVAKVKLREAEYAYDCGVNDTCVAGSHAFSAVAQICKGKAPAALACEVSEQTRRCEAENLVISCPDGSEQVNECLRNGRWCRLHTSGELLCAPACASNVELCINGVITYCAGVDTTAKIDCTALGFSGCKADTSVNHAWCIE